MTNASDSQTGPSVQGRLNELLSEYNAHVVGEDLDQDGFLDNVRDQLDEVLSSGGRGSIDAEAMAAFLERFEPPVVADEE